MRREVALKVVDEHADPVLALRMEREGRLTARARHAHVVPLHESGRARLPDGRSVRYLALDWVDGGTLADRLDPRRPEAALELLAQACRGVEHAHSLGIVHRDLKLDNVLVTRDGRALVADLGVARDHTPSELTGTEEQLGTTHYMSPEQVRGEAELGPGTDVWALGAMLHELICGVKPFDGASPAVLYRRILADPPVCPRPLQPRARLLLPVCRKALATRPAERYAHAGERAEELERWLAGGRPLAVDTASMELVGWLQRARRQPRRWGLALACLVVSIALIGGWWARTGERHRLREQARTALDSGDWAAGLAACERLRDLDPHGPGPVLERELNARLQRAARELAASAQRAEQRRHAARAAGDLRRQVDELVARTYIAQGEVVPAVHALIQALDAATPLAERAESAELWGQLANAWQLVGSPEQACEAYERAIALSPAETWLRTSLAQAYLDLAQMELLIAGRSSGRIEASASRAREELERAGPGLDLRQRDRWLIEAYLLVLRRDSEALVDHCLRSVEQLAEQPGSEAFLVIAGNADGPPERKLGCYDRALQIRPHDPIAHLCRGHLLQMLGRSPEAEPDMRRAVALAPRSLLARVGLSNLLAELGRISEAVDCFEPATHHHDKARAWSHLGALLLKAGRFAEALTQAERALVLEPDSSPALLLRSALREHQGDTAGAMADLDRVIANDPTQVTAYGLRGVRRFAQRDLVGALADLNRAVELAPRDSNHYNSRGFVLFNLRRYDEAAADYDRAIELDPRNTMPLHNRGLLHETRGEFAAALADYDRAIALEPHHLDHHITRGNLCYNAGRVDEATASYSRAIELAPERGDGYYRRSLSHLRAGQAAEGLIDIDRAIALDPRAPHHRLVRARIHEEGGRLDAALADCEAALAIDPHHLEALSAGLARNSPWRGPGPR